MDFGVIGEFRARPGHEAGVAAAIRHVVPPTAAETACLSISAWQSNRTPGLFFIHSRWIDEAAFDTHAALPHTVAFIAAVEPLLTHTVSVARLSRFA